MKNCPCVYTSETAMEFHYLLLGTIAGYKNMLTFLNIPPKHSDLNIIYNVSWRLTHLLWRISHSSILREHLAFLTTTELLKLDDNVQKCDVHDAAKVDVDEIDVQEVVHQELMALNTIHQKHGDIALSFVRWIRLLISHVTALDILLLFLQHETLKHKKLHIHMIAVRVPKKFSLPWVNILQRAVPLDEQQLSEVVQQIYKYTQEYTMANPNNKKSIFFRFKNDGDMPKWIMNVIGTVHCELALAFLLIFLKNATSDDQSRQTLESWFSNASIYFCYLS